MMKRRSEVMATGRVFSRDDFRKTSHLCQAKWNLKPACTALKKEVIIRTNKIL